MGNHALDKGEGFREHEDEVHTVTFSRDGWILARGAKDGVVLLWKVAAREFTYGHRLRPPKVRVVAEFAPGLAIAAGIGAHGQKTILLQLGDLSKSWVPVGSDLNLLFTYMQPNILAFYDQTTF